MPAERARVALASRNPGKLRELRALLPEWEIEALDTTGIGEEEGSTFHENARAKALFARGRADPGKWALGEDSGLEVDGLHGAPGIRSARYAGDEATDEENLRRLLDELELLEGAARRARYVCELVLVSPSGEEHRGRGTLEGAIGRETRGSGGFGYDPVFVPFGETRTVAELGDGWKAGASHRARAARALQDSVHGTASDRERPLC
jgi:XTP/dITP diphosphohydrolase